VAAAAAEADAPAGVGVAAGMGEVAATETASYRWDGEADMGCIGGLACLAGVEAGCWSLEAGAADTNTRGVGGRKGLRAAAASATASCAPTAALFLTRAMLERSDAPPDTQWRWWGGGVSGCFARVTLTLHEDYEGPHPTSASFFAE